MVASAFIETESHLPYIVNPFGKTWAVANVWPPTPSPSTWFGLKKVNVIPSDIDELSAISISFVLSPSGFKAVTVLITTPVLVV